MGNLPGDEQELGSEDCLGLFWGLKGEEGRGLVSLSWGGGGKGGGKGKGERGKGKGKWEGGRGTYGPAAVEGVSK